MQTSTSVLIISFNCWHYLNECLKSILASGYPFGEILVLDNASVDGTPDKLRANFPRVQIVQNSQNIGHVRAANQGFRLVKGERILLLDADTEVAQDAIHLMSNFLDAHPEVCMIAPRTLNSDATLQEGARRFPSVINGLFGRQSLLTRIFPDNPFSKHYLARDIHNTQSPFPVEQIGSACMLFRKSLLDQTGFWDEGYGGYFVDSDWCKRIYNIKGLIYCIPAAIITHHDQNSSSKKKNPLRIIEFHKGAFRFYLKHHTLGLFDPRTILAGFLLSLRTMFLLILNEIKRPHSTGKDPLSK